MQAQPRAIGSATLDVDADSAGHTRLKNLRQSGSSKLVFPRTHGRDAEAVMVNTAGGITGGDRFRLDVNVSKHATLSLTTQAAERAYRAQSGEVGKLSTTLNVHSGARLNWLPQELILYDNCALSRRLEVDLANDAQFLMVEPVVFGRHAMGEKLNSVNFRDRIRITRSGAPLYADGMDLIGNATAQLARRAIANGAGAMASVVLVDPQASRFIERIREMLPVTAGASMIHDDTLVIRHLARDSFDLRSDLIPILEYLKQHPLPVSWRL